MADFPYVVPAVPDHGEIGGLIATGLSMLERWRWGQHPKEGQGAPRGRVRDATYRVSSAIMNEAAVTNELGVGEKAVACRSYTSESLTRSDRPWSARFG